MLCMIICERTFPEDGSVLWLPFFSTLLALLNHECLSGNNQAGLNVQHRLLSTNSFRCTGDTVYDYLWANVSWRWFGPLTTFPQYFVGISESRVYFWKQQVTVNVLPKLWLHARRWCCIELSMSERFLKMVRSTDYLSSVLCWRFHPARANVQEGLHWEKHENR